MILCDRTIEKYPSSFGADQCRSLRSNILGKSLSVVSQEASAVSVEDKFLLQYKNISQVYLKVVAFNPEKN